MAKDHRTDRRVQRTRNLLHGALATLIHEKAYDDIVVKEILARADVGRSTFYSHFRDKDGLLDSGIRDMLRAAEAAPLRRSTHSTDHVLRFSLPLFEHIAQHRDANPSVIPARLTVVHGRLERELAARVAAALEQSGRPHPSGRDRAQLVPNELLANYIASAFLVVLDWWVHGDRSMPARKANELFRALVLPTLSCTSY